jgi:hypothetical protein
VVTPHRLFWRALGARAAARALPLGCAAA